MVNFDNETTVGIPALDIVRILVLEARANVLSSLEEYHKLKFNNVGSNTNLIRARLITWFLEHQAYLKRIYNSTEDMKIYKGVFNDLLSEKPLSQVRIIEIICFLNETLDNLKITRLDLRKNYDRSSIETENIAHGL